MSHTTLQRHISRLMALLLCALLLLPCVPVVRADGGSCGDSLTWDFDGITLTISGSGAMYDYSEFDKAPWNSVSGQIQRLSLPDGLTRIGKRAFYSCTALLSVTVPGSVREIGDAAFCKNSSMTMVTLNSGLETIGRSAFESCTSLQEVRIPGTVTEIGSHAFYCCESLSYAYIPGSVQSFGSGIFSYCTRLSRVDMEAPASALPGWSFYGCDSLDRIQTGSGSVSASELKQTNDPVPLNPSPAGPSEPDLPVQQPSADDTAGKSNTITETGSLVEKTENSIITNDVTITQNQDSTKVDIDISATVINPEGWNEVVDQIQSNGQTSDVTIYVPDDHTVPGEVLQELAGSKINLTINTSSGTTFKIDCSTLNADNIKSDLDLSYTLAPLDTVPEGIDSTKAYQLTFNSSCNINVEVMIRLPLENSRRAASLYQFGEGDVYGFVQSVVVDNDGYAHYYLGSINHGTPYLIAMDVKGIQSEQAIIPDTLYDEYRLVDHSTGKEYVITGRKSSWNMGLGRVMAILAVVMVSAIGVIGFVMYFWNKQRLKNGYVPQWDDEDE